MDLFDYLNDYQYKTIDKYPLNEIDMVLFSILAYPHYEDFIGKKEIYNAKKMLKFLYNFDVSDLMDRKVEYLRLLKRVCQAPRYEGIKFYHFRVNHDEETTKQFQAITLILGKIVVVSYCGTDGTTVGFKEDLNMSYLEVTPGEIEAIEYLKYIQKKKRPKYLYLVGHSKGGRLAEYSAKHFTKKERLLGVYTFDAPNFKKEFYDSEYEKISPLMNVYLPEESIIGRLIAESAHYKIVKSTRHLLMQHDTLSWEIEDNHFVYSNEFSKRSTRIVNALNGVLEKYDDNTKKEFTDTLFDLIESANIKSFTTKEENIAMLKSAIPIFKVQWKNTPKEDRKSLKLILLTLVVDFLKNKKN